ncbi:MerR family transcriptional regulator [Sphingomonas flavalba]|uniref:MerR family transcriptional regulator n=1 Tax=Sphingomonas flavalba TaxID=2559804 RepID=UPI00109DDD34|nr:helix-turn-helix domain-containing protein [Sphingomonas flavalba]
MSALTIGRLAALTGTSNETIRYYETIGLLAAPPRTAGNYRAYDGRHVARLSFIRRARALGFTLDQVRTLLALSDDRTRPCGEVDDMTREQLAMVDHKIADLTALRRELSGLLAQCHAGTIAECGIIEALGPGPRRPD